jgi:integrase/recombinase XerD
MKTNRFGQAAVLSSTQLDQLIAALPAKHHQVLAEVCRRTGCRISEGRQLTWASISQSHITYPKTITKAKLKSRTIPQVPKLREVLSEWRHEWAVLNGRKPMNGDFVFPGRFAGQCLSSRAFMDALNAASHECGLEGVSSHSFRRSALTSAHNAGVPLSHLMALSGHESMSALQRYLHVTEDQKDQAALSFA